MDNIKSWQDKSHIFTTTSESSSREQSSKMEKYLRRSFLLAEESKVIEEIRKHNDAKAVELKESDDAKEKIDGLMVQADVHAGTETWKVSMKTRFFLL